MLFENVFILTKNFFESRAEKMAAPKNKFCQHFFLYSFCDLQTMKQRHNKCHSIKNYALIFFINEFDFHCLLKVTQHFFYLKRSTQNYENFNLTLKFS